MIYINYYSKTRGGIGADPVLFQQELEKNKGRIVTKIVTQEAYTPSALMQSNMQRALRNINIPYDRSYTEFRIPKSSGGWRTLQAPNDELKAMQRKLVRVLYKYKALPHNAAHGFVPYRNSMTALKVHQTAGARWFLKLDIEDFFPSIKRIKLIEQLQHVHPTTGCAHPVHPLYDLLGACCKEDALPQGSPASPILSNLFLIGFDDALTKALPTFTYTRYADDLLISSPTHFDWRYVEALVARLLAPYGLVLKHRKTRYGNFNGSNWNLGLMYNNQSNITVGYKNKKLIKNRIHNYIRDNNVEELASLAGMISYYLAVEPEYFTALIRKTGDVGLANRVGVIL